MKQFDPVQKSVSDIREELIAAARIVAEKIYMAKGRVTGPEVLRALEKSLADKMQRVDHRFVGVVFKRGWKRIGYENTGSHCRPVSIWSKHDPKIEARCD